MWMTIRGIYSTMVNRRGPNGRFKHVMGIATFAPF
jgi:hypothetical protein